MPMDPPHDDSTSSPCPPHPKPSDKRTRIAPSCPYNICPECRELQDLEAQIMDTHEGLATGPSQALLKIKGRINHRHDWLTSDLPLEVVSHIFTLITDAEEPKSDRSQRPDSWNPNVMLGAVCRRWREITLGTPHLWTNVNINPPKDAAFPALTEEWLSRSRSLPLSLNIYASAKNQRRPTEPSSTLPYSDVLQILRSHATRWKDLKLRLPAPILHTLLAGLEDRLTVDSLEVNMFGPIPISLDTIPMKYPFAPMRLLFHKVPLPFIPIQWNRLVYLKAEHTNPDALIHIFQHAQNLEQCILRCVKAEFGRQYSKPDSPMTNASIREVDTHIRARDCSMGNLLRHLTLPSLETFRYGISHDPNDEEMNDLANFIDRSRLQGFGEFYFYYHDFGHRRNRDWYRLLPSITSLELDFELDYDGARIQDYIERLGAHLKPIALPSLRELKIRTSIMNTHAWNGLAAMFDNTENRTDTESTLGRPLTSVTIRAGWMSWSNVDQKINLGKATYLRLRAIQDLGTVLQVFDREGIDLLGPTIGNRLARPFLQFDDDHGNED